MQDRSLTNPPCRRAAKGHGVHPGVHGSSRDERGTKHVEENLRGAGRVARGGTARPGRQQSKFAEIRPERLVRGGRLYLSAQGVDVDLERPAVRAGRVGLEGCDRWSPGERLRPRA